MNRSGGMMRGVGSTRRQGAGVSGEAKGAERAVGTFFMGSWLGVREWRAATVRAALRRRAGVRHRTGDTG
jgi:hypothetical protein